MTFFVEDNFSSGRTGSVYHARGPIKRSYEEHFLRVEARPALDYADMTDYIRSWPDKLVTFVADRLCDDDMAPFVRELYEYICQADRDGPAFEEWRLT